MRKLVVSMVFGIAIGIVCSMYAPPPIGELKTCNVPKLDKQSLQELQKEYERLEGWLYQVRFYQGVDMIYHPHDPIQMNIHVVQRMVAYQKRVLKAHSKK